MFPRLPISTALLAICLAAVAAQIAPAADPAKAPNRVRVTYQVADLVMSPTVFPNEPARSKGQSATCENELMKLITATVEPASWSQQGGRGSIDYFGPAMSFVVDQTPDVQEQVADLLSALRKLSDVKVVVETRFVVVTDECAERIGTGFRSKPAVISTIRTIGADGLERIGVDFEATNPSGNAVAQPTDENAPVQVLRFMNDKQLHQLMERAADDTKSNVVSAPKMSLINRQTGTVSIGEGGPNTVRYAVNPVVSADRRFVKVAFKVEQKDVTPAVCEKTVVIPDGGTVLLGGFTATREVETECPQGILSDIPYLNRLFRVVETKSEPRQVFMLVTPRIVVQQEEEEKVGPATAACPKCREADCCATAIGETTTRQAKVITELLRAYDAACSEGRGEEADKLARAALILDPTCFHRKR